MPNNLAVLQKREEVNNWEALEVSLLRLDFLSEREAASFRDSSPVFQLTALTEKFQVFFKFLITA